MRRSLKISSLVLCVAAGGVAVAALARYAQGEPGPDAGLQSMSPLTALGIALLSMSVACRVLGRARACRRLGAAAGALAVAGLCSYAVWGSDELSGRFAAMLQRQDLSHVGRMSVATAIGIGLVAVAAGLRRARAVAADRLAAATATLSGFALLGHAYGVGDLQRLPLFNTMALNTAGCLFALALAALAADPSSGAARILAASGSADRSITRRLVATIAVMPLFGLALVRATAHDSLGLGASMALLVATSVVTLTWLAMRDGRIRDELAMQREAAEAERAAGARLREELNAQLEAALARKVEELRLEVAERRIAEEATMRAQKMEAVGRLTGGIAHDFNNLLQALAGNVALLQRSIGPDDPLRKFVDNAQKAVGKGAKLTGQLMSFSRSQRLTIKPVLVRAVLQDASELARLSLGSGLTLDVEMPGDDTWVSADAQQLELAVMNLLMNARDAKPRSGSVSVRCAPTTPPVGGAAPRYVAITVADDGQGMPPEVSSRAGEPFFSTKTQGQGTGLGLAQVFGFARQCGGEARIDSVPGLGTAVAIVLPAADAVRGEAEPSTPAGPASADARRPERILVIDDDDGVRAVVVQGLRDAGFQVWEAADGPSALALLAMGAPAAAVIDFMMPGMDGAEVARRARALWPSLPIVFVSGYADTLALDGIGGAGVLRKPFDMPTLREAVEALLAPAK